LIAANRRLDSLRDILDEARALLSLPRPDPPSRQPPAPTGSPEAARRLFAMAKPIAGTLAEAYLRSRALTGLRNCTALRFHPRCFYRGDEDDPRDRVPDAWPALIAAVTDLSGAQMGA
ncbi:DNA primase, partial [Salmonella enterica subsp. enterica serovar Enteritidis]|nr:DNA primase [Salmonella enterica subsp. enterica serovar Enteritidis]